MAFASQVERKIAIVAMMLELYLVAWYERVIVLHRRDRFGRMGGACLPICFCTMKGQKQLDTYNECTGRGNHNKRYYTRWMMSKLPEVLAKGKKKSETMMCQDGAKAVAEEKVARCCSSNTRNRSCFGRAESSHTTAS